MMSFVEFDSHNAILDRLIRRLDEFDFGVPSLDLHTRLKVARGRKANGGERNLVIILGMHATSCPPKTTTKSITLRPEHWTFLIVPVTKRCGPCASFRGEELRASPNRASLRRQQLFS